MARMFEKYLRQLFRKYKTGEAGERSYYPLLENLLKEFKESQVIIEAKNSPVGIPDFKVETLKNLLVGYVEAKDVGRDLDKLSDGEQAQIKRYIKEYPKLIVTNFIEFRLYENHEFVESTFISLPVTLEILEPVIKDEGKLVGLLERFFSTTIPQIFSSKNLAELLALKTHVLRGLVAEQINFEDKVVTPVEELLKAFRSTISPQMTEQEFADVYSQTVTFGLFTARLNSHGTEFNRKSAVDFIPHTVPLLRKVFWIISGQDVPQYIEWQVDEIAEILANTKIDKIQNEFFSEGKGRDPIIHFYETFLSVYDPKERAKRGVYYTPLPVVSYITRAINQILKDTFHLNDGFADSSVLVLDPAAGTLTFPAQAIHLAREEFLKNYGEGSWIKHVKDHILMHYYAFELLMAPYSIGHLKIALLLKEMGYEMQEDDRFKLYLTNTLEMDEVKEVEFLGAKEIAEESKMAYEIKHKTPVLVIMGNPPYSVSSSNVIKEGSDFYRFYESYKENVRKEEKNIQPLSDDYIKFIAFAHWKINKIGKGIVGMITNNSYLDGLIHRDLRRNLLEDFDEIFILNLHGDAKKQEKTPNGGKDENVFDIQQGVGIILLVKNGGKKGSVRYADLWGLRNVKYRFLEEKSIDEIGWQDLTPTGPSYPFIIKDERALEIYSSFYNFPEIFGDYSSGITTGDDNNLTGYDKEPLLEKVRGLFNFDESKVNRDLIKYYSYKPFNEKYVYFDKGLIQRPRIEIMKSMLEGNNLGFVLMRKIIGPRWEHVLVTDNLVDKNFYGFQSYLFPLYLDGDKNQHGLFSPEETSGRKINFQQPFLEFIDKNLIAPNPSNNNVAYEEIFYYIYAILFSNIYRQNYQEFLKNDFPKIPLTSDYSLFKSLSKLGEGLVNLHLLRSRELDNPKVKFRGTDSNLIEKQKYLDRKIYINKAQYFEEINDVAWNYSIGGYQVLLKLLKDRRGKDLSSDDVKEYCKAADAIQRTILIQKDIDKLYPEVEKTLIKI